MADDLKLKLILSATDGISNVVKSAVNSSSQQFEHLQDRISETAERFYNCGRTIRNWGLGLTATGLGVAHALKLTSAINDNIQLEHQLRAVGNVGDLTAQQIKGLEKEIVQISKSTNNYNSTIAEGLGTMVAGGFAPQQAIKYMSAISKAATAEGADINDMSKMAIALSDNLKISSDEMLKVFDMASHAGKEGRFELAAMARYFPEITASAGILGIKGTQAVANIGSAMQIAMKGAGTEGEAATNVSAFLSGLTQPFVTKRFEEAFGVTIKSITDTALKQGADPILKVMEVVKNKTGGDVNKISNVFRDKSMSDFVKIMTLNLDEYREMTLRVNNAHGVIDNDFNNMMNTTQEQWKKTTITMASYAKEGLEKPLNVVKSILGVINSNPIVSKGIFNAVVGTIGLGTALTTFSAIPFVCGNITKGFGNILEAYKNLDIYIWAKAPNLGKTINFNLRESIKNIPTIWNTFTNSAKQSTQAIIDFIKNSPRNAYDGIKNGLNAIQMGFKNFIPNCKNAILAMRTFNITCSLNPIGLIVGAVIAGSFLIYKYWKPITQFFRGTFIGIQEGLRPLQPMFNKVGQAVKPLADGIKRMFMPINTDGTRALEWGKAFGNWIANCIKGAVKLYGIFKQIVTLGGRIKIGGQSYIVLSDNKEDGSHFNGLTKVPYDNYKANLHKDEAVLTAKEANQWRNLKNGNNSISLTYSPVINMPNTINSATKSEFLDELRKHKTEIYAMLKDLARREDRRAYV
ncbi:MAG: phage tail tape measure protein [Candidatus Gastranaerophilaceae bacterium]